MAVKGPGSERLGVGAAMRPPPTGSAVYVFLGVGRVGSLERRRKVLTAAHRAKKPVQYQSV